MAQWISRLASLGVLAAYLIRWFVFGRWPGFVFSFAILFGLVVIWFGRWMNDRFGPTTRMGTEPREMGCLVYGLGWFALLFPAFWWLLVWTMFL